MHINVFEICMGSSFQIGLWPIQVIFILIFFWVFYFKKKTQNTKENKIVL